MNTATDELKPILTFKIIKATLLTAWFFSGTDCEALTVQVADVIPPPNIGDSSKKTYALEAAGEIVLGQIGGTAPFLRTKAGFTDLSSCSKHPSGEPYDLIGGTTDGSNTLLLYSPKFPNWTGPEFVHIKDGRETRRQTWSDLAKSLGIEGPGNWMICGSGHGKILLYCRGHVKIKSGNLETHYMIMCSTDDAYILLKSEEETRRIKHASSDFRWYGDLTDSSYQIQKDGSTLMKIKAMADPNGKNGQTPPQRFAIISQTTATLIASCDEIAAGLKAPETANLNLTNIETFTLAGGQLYLSGFADSHLIQISKNKNATLVLSPANEPAENAIAHGGSLVPYPFQERDVMVKAFIYRTPIVNARCLIFLSPNGMHEKILRHEDVLEIAGRKMVVDVDDFASRSGWAGAGYSRLSNGMEARSVSGDFFVIGARDSDSHQDVLLLCRLKN